MYDVIVVAGGSARRLGGIDKPALEIGGRPLLDHVLAAVTDAARIVVVGPERPTAIDVIWTREQPIGGGPVAAIAAALDHVDAPYTLVLAADLPFVAPAVPLLLAAAQGRDVALLGANPLIAAWRTPALRHAVGELPTVQNAPVRLLLADVDGVTIDDDGGWGDDCDTWDELAAARARLT